MRFALTFLAAVAYAALAAQAGSSADGGSLEALLDQIAAQHNASEEVSSVKAAVDSSAPSVKVPSRSAAGPASEFLPSGRYTPARFARADLVLSPPQLRRVSLVVRGSMQLRKRRSDGSGLPRLFRMARRTHPRSAPTSTSSAASPLRSTRPLSRCLRRQLCRQTSCRRS